MPQQFYRITLREAIALHECGLISSTALLYFFIRIRLAPGWKMTLHQREISKQLGISRTAFYKAISRLKDKGLINWEAPNGVVVCCARQNQDLLDKSGTQWTNPGLSGQIRDSVDKSGTGVDKSGTGVDKSGTGVDKSGTGVDKSGTGTTHKPPADNSSQPSSDYYQIFTKSLSDNAREKFLNFVREKISDFKAPINDVEGWLAGKNQAGQYRFRVYYAMFQKEVGEAIAPSRDWENHPKYREWIEALRNYPGAFYRVDSLDGLDAELKLRKWVFGTPEDRKERQAFAQWASDNNKI